MSTNNKFFKNETILQTLKRINTQVKSEHINQNKNTIKNTIKNTKQNKQIRDILPDNHCLICEDTIESTKDCASDVCNNIFNTSENKKNHTYPDDDAISYQSYPMSNKSHNQKNIETNSMSNFSLDNDENSRMFIKIISNLEERLSNMETKKKRKHNQQNSQQ